MADAGGTPSQAETALWAAPPHPPPSPNLVLYVLQAHVTFPSINSMLQDQ